MSATSLTISTPIEDSVLDTVGDMNEIAASLAIDYVLIGAKARDIVLTHHFGAKPQRATADIDFAVYVAGWEEFHQTHEALIAKGYEPERQQHRLHSPGGDTVDIVPFGGLATEDDAIQWPPDGQIVMSVMGFDEACRTAYLVRYESRPDIEFKVANLESQILLKLIAWSERAPNKRTKDASDISFILGSYHLQDQDGDTFWSPEWSGAMEDNEWNHTLVAMQLLGQRAASLASAVTHRYVSCLLNDQLDKRDLERLERDESREFELG
ncbi:nucleotidyl transferase AbiEii/AbiGii toxin family protein [Salinicola halophilus]|uniref:nucleotidyl transferase AbiEii/AbiGii toxin family protein n=1 Tax=Salinicola halophilus TaxID=184065 RepID=UPI000DA2234C|nr:nucleotidyl transferase AbiEii/AbiGii toxin family protein [Salinicola halophilus]